MVLIIPLSYHPRVGSHFIDVDSVENFRHREEKIALTTHTQFQQGLVEIFFAHPFHVFLSPARQSCVSVPPRRIRVFSSGLKFCVCSSHALLPHVRPSCMSVLPALETECMCFYTRSTDPHIRSTSSRTRLCVFSRKFDWSHR